MPRHANAATSKWLSGSGFAIEAPVTSAMRTEEFIGVVIM